MTQQRTAMDWMLFTILSLIWASAYTFTRGAVETVPPGLLVPTRLTIGAFILVGAMRLRGETFPPLRDRRRWAFMIAMGIFGLTLPFFMITHAQRTVDSSLAALYVATAPIFTAIGAHFVLSDERMNLQKALGVGVGFLGVAVLFAPDALAGFGTSTVSAQLLLLGATASYAVSTMIARTAPTQSSLSFAAGFVGIGAMLAWPLALTSDISAVQPSWISILCVIALGMGPSALASMLYMVVVKRAGATFLSLTGYAIPIISAAFGWLIFGEVLGAHAWLAFALILSGVWLSQRRRRRVVLSENGPVK